MTRSLGAAPAPHEFERIEMASRDEIAGLQLDRMRWTIRHMWANVPYQRARFEAAGVGPDDLRSLDDLVRFPFTTLK